MKFAVIALFAAAAATASVDAKTTKLHVRVHAHNEKQGAICYKQCPQGQWCSRGQSECRGPKAGTTECFNYATALWIPKCDPGFVCRNGKCDYAKKSKSATKHHEDDHDHDEDDEGDDDEEREYGDDDDDDEERDGDDDEHEDEHEGEDDGEGPPPKHRKSHRQSKQGAICYKQCPQGQWCARGTQTCRGPKAGTTECFNYATALWIPKCDPGFVCRNGKCDYAKKSKSATKHHEDDHDHDEDDEGEDEERDGDEDDEDHDHEDEDDEERAYGDEHEGEDDGEGPPPKHLKSHRQSKQGAICYKQCPQGQWCARGTQTCRGPKAGTSECFNYATAQWIPKCDPGFVCRNGKCDYK